MKKYRIIQLAALVGMVFSAQAATYTYQPSDPREGASSNDSNLRDMQDLDHNYFYTWGINVQLSPSANVRSAILEIRNIRDWKVEPDALFIHLLDNTLLGENKVQDQTSPNGSISDDFLKIGNPQGPLIGTYEYLDSIFPATQNISYTFDSSLLAVLNTFIHNGDGSLGGTFGIGFDPDCHYYNDGIKLTITVPDGGSVIGMLGMSLLGLSFLGKRMHLSFKS
jgi:hypothetical protein